MDGKCEWFIKDLKAHFSFYNLINVHKLNLDITDKAYLYFLVLMRLMKYIINYKKEKFIILPTLLLKTSTFPENTNYIYCGNGKIIINNNKMSKKLVMRIDTSFLPFGFGFVSLNDDIIYNGLKDFMNSEYVKYLIKKHNLESRNALFKDMSRMVSLLALKLLYTKIG